jgi:hypothetical protein
MAKADINATLVAMKLGWEPTIPQDLAEAGYRLFVGDDSTPRLMGRFWYHSPIGEPCIPEYDTEAEAIAAARRHMNSRRKK